MDFSPNKWLRPEYPRLYLEYVPGNSLTEHTPVSAPECLQVLQQCLSALDYLHNNNPPIIHRDIKTDNILVQNRYQGTIEVKLADFGLSKDYDDLSTICGNRLYLAPEVFLNEQYTVAGGRSRKSYSSAVDIWSLGTLAYSLLCDLPKWHDRHLSAGTKWADKVRDKFSIDWQKQPEDPLRRFLLEAMVVIAPESRWTAKDCHATAVLLQSPYDTTSIDTSTEASDAGLLPASYSDSGGSGSGQSTIIARATFTGSRAAPHGLVIEASPNGLAVANDDKLRSSFTHPQLASADKNPQRVSTVSFSSNPSSLMSGSNTTGGDSSQWWNDPLHPKMNGGYDLVYWATDRSTAAPPVLEPELPDHEESSQLLSGWTSENSTIARSIRADGPQCSSYSGIRNEDIIPSGLQTDRTNSYPSRAILSAACTSPAEQTYHANPATAVYPFSHDTTLDIHRPHHEDENQYPESESEVEYYEKCWMDPLYPLGGGSSLTISGGHPADKSWASTFISERPKPENLVDPMDGSDLKKQPSNVTSLCQPPAAGGSSIHGWGNKKTVQDARNDSKQCLAQAVLQTVYEDKSDISRLNAPSPDDGCATDCDIPTDDGDSSDGDRAEHLVKKKRITERQKGEQFPGITSAGPRDLVVPNSPERGPVRCKRRTSAQDKATLEAAYLLNPGPN